MAPKTDNFGVLSIDFDFWIPEDPMLDMGHFESELFIRVLWQTRLVSDINLKKTLTVSMTETPNPRGLANFLSGKGLTAAPNQMAVAESHASILHYLEGLNNLDIIHIDAHHDFGYGENVKDDCAGWVRKLVEENRVRRVRLFYPTWRQKERMDVDWREETDERVEQWRANGVVVEVHHGLENVPDNFHVEKTFVCRSGAWSPPWTDMTFLAMVQHLMMVYKHEHCTIYTYEDLMGFVREMDYRRVELQAEEYDKMRKGMFP